MRALMDYFVLVVNKLVDILNTLKFGDNFSLLYYILAAIIIGFIIKLIKGGANEFEHSFNSTTGYIINTATAKYSNKYRERKQQIMKEKAFRDGMVAASSKLDTTSYLLKRNGLL